MGGDIADPSPSGSAAPRTSKLHLRARECLLVAAKYLEVHQGLAGEHQKGGSGGEGETRDDGT